MPDVSVVIPAYNSAHYLPAALDSVLAQTATDLELLVVDDGSTDDTAAAVGRYGPSVRYIPQSNRGVAEARNRGIAESRGRYVAFLDADDTWRPHKLQTQLARLRNGRAGVVYSAFHVIGSNLLVQSERRSPRRGDILEDLLLGGNVVGTPSTVVCRRELLEAAGGFDPSLSQCADWDMWIRLAAGAEFDYVDEPLTCYREHEGNMSRDVTLLERDSVRVLEKAFARPGLPERLRGRRREALARNARVLAGAYFQARQIRAFLRCAAIAVVLRPRELGYIAAAPVRAARRRRSAVKADGA